MIYGPKDAQLSFRFGGSVVSTLSLLSYDYGDDDDGDDDRKEKDDYQDKKQNLNLLVDRRAVTRWFGSRLRLKKKMTTCQLPYVQVV